MTRKRTQRVTLKSLVVRVAVLEQAERERKAMSEMAQALVDAVRQEIRDTVETEVNDLADSLVIERR